MSKRRVNLGKLGEQKAVEYLQKQGYKVLERNFHTRFGEIDIIAIDRSASLRPELRPRGSGQVALVFVEVKTRWSKKYGLPEEAVTPRKISSIIKTGQYYKILHPKTPDLMQVDVIAIELDSSGNFQSMRHLENVTG